MSPKLSIREGFPITLVLSSLILGPTQANAESRPVMTRVEYVPVQAISHDIGSKSMRGYYVQSNGACSVVLMIAEKIDPETSVPLSAARMRFVLQPGAIADLDSAEGRSLKFTCGQAATRLVAEEGETKTLTPQQRASLSD